MNYKYLKGILLYFIVLLMALSLIGCGSGSAGISISSREVINESMDFQVRDDASPWEYKNSTAYTGIKKFRIDWNETSEISVDRYYLASRGEFMLKGHF